MKKTYFIILIVFFANIVYAQNTVKYDYFSGTGQFITKEQAQNEMRRLRAIVDFKGPLGDNGLPKYDRRNNHIKWPYKFRHIEGGISN
ncbi:hypothetical protein QUF70_13015 [Desulfobacterales bacterium HSG17]|nr:hypothetical protein [Desulfobacterales bacterium HSG17]